MKASATCSLSISPIARRGQVCEPFCDGLTAITHSYCLTVLTSRYSNCPVRMVRIFILDLTVATGYEMKLITEVFNKILAGRVKCFIPRLYTSLIRDYLPKTRKVIRYNGIESPVLVCPLDPVVPYYQPPWYLSHTPGYEDAEITALRDHCESGDDVVIVGGGFGVTAVVAAELVGGDGSVTVFEGSYEGFQRTNETIAHNGVEDQITVNHAIVGISVSMKSESRDAPTISASELPDGNVFEIDCEGAEVDVLTQMEVRPRIIIVETHGQFGVNREEVADIIISMGYEIIKAVDKDIEGLTVLIAENINR